MIVDVVSKVHVGGSGFNAPRWRHRTVANNTLRPRPLTKHGKNQKLRSVFGGDGGGGVGGVACYAVPAAMAVLVYANSLEGDFVHDDVEAVLRNPDVTSNRAPLTDVFVNDFWGSPMSSNHSHKSYRPLTTLLFRLNYSACSGRSWCFHATNVFLHAAATALVAAVCRRVLAASAGFAAVAASLFALHPVHTEAVSGIVGCAELVAANFTLLSFILYTESLRRRRLSLEVGSHALSLLAVLGKESGVMSVAVNVGFAAVVAVRSSNGALAADAFPGALRKRRIIRDIIVFLLLVLSRLAVPAALSTSSSSSSPSSSWAPPPPPSAPLIVPKFSPQDNPAAFHPRTLVRTLTFLYLPARAFWQLLCPSLLSYDWQMSSVPVVSSLADPRIFAAAAFYAGLAALCARLLFGGSWADGKLKSEGLGGQSWGDGDGDGLCLGAGLLFLVLPYLPASNVGCYVGFVMAERVLYIPSIGFCLLLSLGLKRLQTAAETTTAAVAAASNHSTASDAAKSNGNSGPQPRRATWRGSSGGEGFAWRLLLRWPRRLLLRCPPGRRRRLCECALLSLLAAFAIKTLARNGDWADREHLFRSGVRSVPHNAKVHYNFANWNKDDGNRVAAVRHYKEAIRLWPFYTLAHNNLATVVEDRTEAERHLKIALSIDPGHANSRYNIALMLRNRGLCSEAVPILELSVAASPAAAEDRSVALRPEAALLLAECLRKKQEDNARIGEHRPNLWRDRWNGTNGDGGGDLAQDMHSDPADFGRSEGPNDVVSALAEAYMSLGEWEKAEILLRKLLETDTESATVALYQLSQVEMEQNKSEDALVTIRRAKSNIDCSSTSSSTLLCVRILAQEADISREMGRYAEAVRRYRTALSLCPAASSCPDHPDLLLSLGSTLHALGDLAAASKVYDLCQRVSVISPRNLREDQRRRTLEANMAKLERMIRSKNSTTTN